MKTLVLETEGLVELQAQIQIVLQDLEERKLASERLDPKYASSINAALNEALGEVCKDCFLKVSNALANTIVGRTTPRIRLRKSEAHVLDAVSRNADMDPRLSYQIQNQLKMI